MLNDDGDRFPYFFLNLFVALMCAESAMMAIAAIIPHYVSVSRCNSTVKHLLTESDVFACVQLSHGRSAMLAGLISLKFPQNE